MTRVESIRRALVRVAEHHAERWESALVTGNAQLARESAARYRAACRTLQNLRPRSAGVHAA